MKRLLIDLGPEDFAKLTPVLFEIDADFSVLTLPDSRPPPKVVATGTKKLPAPKPTPTKQQSVYAVTIPNWLKATMAENPDGLARSALLDLAEAAGYWRQSVKTQITAMIREGKFVLDWSGKVTMPAEEKTVG